MLRAETPFYLQTNHKIFTLEELISILEEMDNEFYIYFVNKEKNDFSNWISKSMHLPNLAESIKFKNKENTIKILKFFLKNKNIDKNKENHKKQNYIEDSKKEENKIEPQKILIEDSISNTKKTINIGEENIEKELNEKDAKEINFIKKEIRRDTKIIENENKTYENDLNDISYLQKEFNNKKRELENYENNLQRLKNENKVITTEYLKLKERENLIEKLEREAREKLHKSSKLLQKAKEFFSQKDFKKNDRESIEDEIENIKKIDHILGKKILNEEIKIKDSPKEKEKIENIFSENREDWEDIKHLEKEIENLSRQKI